MSKHHSHRWNNIDWNAQWADHAPDYKDGVCLIDLSKYGQVQGEVELLPGPGFGDLSHPTTRLVLRQLLLYGAGRNVIDIGCGSGILSLCAASAGALSVLGIDICPLSVDHARQNAKENQFPHMKFCLPNEVKEVPSNPLILMNMIRTEQLQAWRSLPQLHGMRCTMITSGVLFEETDQAEQMYSDWGFDVQSKVVEENWVCLKAELQ